MLMDILMDLLVIFIQTGKMELERQHFYTLMILGDKNGEVRLHLM